MKKYYFIILLCTIIGTEELSAAKTKFFIATKSNNEDAVSYVSYFEDQVLKILFETYPCTNILTSSGVQAILENEKRKELLGGGDENTFKSLGESLGCDYLISLDVQVNNNNVLLSAFCMQFKKEKILTRAMASTVKGDAGLDAIEKVSKELIDGLKKYEICPFKGNIDVNVASKEQSKDVDEYSVSCNGNEGNYKKTTTVYKTSDQKWKLDKNSQYSADGNVEFKMYEEIVVDEINDCYPCSSGREGGRTSHERTVSTADVQGLSNKSELFGVKIDDARVELNFMDDDTYTIRIKMASKQGDMEEKKDIRAEGTCDNVSENKKTIKKADVGQNLLFGPFNGNAQNKVLSEKGTIKEVDETTKEERTITYQFNLEKD